MNSKAVEKQKEIVIKQLNNIVDVAREIAKQWDMQTIPLKVLWKILDKAKAKEIGDNYSKEHAKAYNKCLKSLYSTCVSVSKRMNAKSITIEALREGVELIKDAYKRIV